jgi:hypothetical protein
MRKHISGASFALLLICFLGTAAARAEVYTSGVCHFSASFPFSPQISAPQASERNERGEVISHLVSTSAPKQGVLMAAVFCDSFDIARSIDIDQALNVERDNFLKELSAQVVTVRDQRTNGHRGRYFSYRSSAAEGEGLVVVVEAKKPVIYLVITMHTSAASPDEISALKTFFASFQLTQ